MMTLSVASLDDLSALTRQLTSLFHPGDVVLLEAEMGCGKTTLVHEFMTHLGFNTVSSPTFTLIHHYETTPPVYHLDLYRLASQQDLESIHIEKYIYPENEIVFIEWPERLGATRPDSYFSISITTEDFETRNVQIEGVGEAAERLEAFVST